MKLLRNLQTQRKEVVDRLHGLINWFASRLFVKALSHYFHNVAQFVF